MNLGQRIRSGVKWLAFGNISRRLLEFAYGVVLARLLVPADFGMIVTVQVFTGVVGLFASGGLGQALVRAKHADDNEFIAVFSFQLLIGVLIYLGFFTAAPYLANFLEHPLYEALIRVSALAFLLRPFTTIRNSWLSRQMQFKTITYVRLASAITTGVLSVGMAWAGLGVWSLVLSGLLGSLIMNLIMIRFIPLRLRLRLDPAVIRKHGAFGFKLTASSFISYLNRESKNLLISKLAGPGFLGLFNKAESLARLPNQMLVPATMEPLFRGMSTVQDNLDQARYLFHRTITLLMAYTAPLYVLLWWVAPAFITFVYGERWSEAGPAMRILTLGGFFLNIIYPCSVVLTVRNRVGREMLAQSLNLVLVILVCYYGLKWGLEGVAWGIVLAHAVMAINLYQFARRALASRTRELLQAMTPGLGLSSAVLLVLATTNALLPEQVHHSPLYYLVTMSLCGGLTFALTFLLLPIPALSNEAARWRGLLAAGFALSPSRKNLQ